MKRHLALVLLIAFPHIALAQSATDKVEQRLAEMLTPGSGKMYFRFAAEQIAWPASKAVTAIGIAIKPYDGPPARLPRRPLPEAAPGPLPSGVPLAAFRDAMRVPAALQLATKPLIWLPSVNVHAPIPIPILARPAKDRASLRDPAFDASLAAALRAFAPTRKGPVPFTPMNLPDPFENQRHGRLRNPPDESATPPVIPLALPSK